MSTYTEQQVAAARVLDTADAAMRFKKEKLVAAVEALGYEASGTKEQLVEKYRGRAQRLLEVAEREWQEEYEARQVESFRDALKAKADERRAQLQSWFDRLGKMASPGQDLRSADGYFAAAAEVELLLNTVRLHDILVDERGYAKRLAVEVIFNELMDEVIREASYSRHRSTSQTSNLWEDAMHVAKAELLRSSYFRSCGLRPERPEPEGI